MCYMSGSTQMENVYAPENEAGMWQWLFGKTVTSTLFLNNGTSDGYVGIAAPSLARILPVCIIILCIWLRVHVGYLILVYYSADWLSKVWWWNTMPGIPDPSTVFTFLSMVCILPPSFSTQEMFIWLCLYYFVARRIPLLHWWCEDQ